MQFSPYDFIHKSFSFWNCLSIFSLGFILSRFFCLSLCLSFSHTFRCHFLRSIWCTLYRFPFSTKIMEVHGIKKGNRLNWWKPGQNCSLFLFFFFCYILFLSFDYSTVSSSFKLLHRFTIVYHNKRFMDVIWINIYLIA